MEAGSCPNVLCFYLSDKLAFNILFTKQYLSLWLARCFDCVKMACFFVWYKIRLEKLKQRNY